MAHLETRYVVNGRIESDDQDLLDQIEAALPNQDDPVLGNEYSLSRTPVTDDEGNETGTEVLSGRMSFAPDGTEFTQDADGNTLVVIESGEPNDNEVLKMNVDDADIFGPAEAAQTLFGQITSHDLATKADGWTVQVYESPEGGVTADAVQAWYKADETRQPERQVEQPDGTTSTEKYVPNSFDPTNHIVVEESG